MATKKIWLQSGSGKIEIQPHVNTQVIRPEKLSWAQLIDSLENFSADFMAQGRRQPAIQKQNRPFA